MLVAGQATHLEMQKPFEVGSQVVANTVHSARQREPSYE